MLYYNRHLTSQHLAGYLRLWKPLGRSRADEARRNKAARQGKQACKHQNKHRPGQALLFFKLCFIGTAPWAPWLPWLPGPPTCLLGLLLGLLLLGTAGVRQANLLGLTGPARPGGPRIATLAPTVGRWSLSPANHWVAIRLCLSIFYRAPPFSVPSSRPDETRQSRQRKKRTRQTRVETREATTIAGRR